MSYKLCLGGGVRRLADQVFIPSDPDNADWRTYQAWLAAPNTPQPADPLPPPIDFSDINNFDKVLKALALVMRDYCNALQAGTYAQKSVAQLRNDFTAKYQSLP